MLKGETLNLGICFSISPSWCCLLLTAVTATAHDSMLRSFLHLLQQLCCPLPHVVNSALYCYPYWRLWFSVASILVFIRLLLVLCSPQWWNYLCTPKHCCYTFGQCCLLHLYLPWYCCCITVLFIAALLDCTSDPLLLFMCS